MQEDSTSKSRDDSSANFRGRLFCEVDSSKRSTLLQCRQFYEVDSSARSTRLRGRVLGEADSSARSIRLRGRLLGEVDSSGVHRKQCCLQEGKVYESQLWNSLSLSIKNLNSFPLFRHPLFIQNISEFINSIFVLILLVEYLITYFSVYIVFIIFLLKSV